ncbi:MAG: 3-hydroxyacyl-ACP dehydratase FabZ [Kiritimatiellia bacterium]|nr:3-hydroxyacyl-ACP dehydratase FabZ [Kiritimatiellia bacterium]
MSAVMELTDILKILPHRYPMLLVDRVLECDFKTRIVGIKNLTFNESFFQGHFPDHPVMPGVLQLEAMAQVGGILLNRVLKTEGEIAYFLSVDNAKFRKQLIPGDCMRIEVDILRIRLGIAKVHGRILCEGEVASESDLMFGFSRD